MKLGSWMWCPAKLETQFRYRGVKRQNLLLVLSVSHHKILYFLLILVRVSCQEASQLRQWWRTHLPTQEMQETWVWFLAWEDLLEKGVETHFSILAWKVLWTEEPGGVQSRIAKSQHWANMPLYPVKKLFNVQSPLLEYKHLEKIF